MPARCRGAPPAPSRAAPSGRSAARNATARTRPPAASCSTQSRWLSPIRRTWKLRASGSMKRGSGLPRPNGPSAPSRAARPGDSAVTWSAPSSARSGGGGGRGPSSRARRSREKARERVEHVGAHASGPPPSDGRRPGAGARPGARRSPRCRDRSPAPSARSPCRPRPSCRSPAPAGGGARPGAPRRGRPRPATSPRPRPAAAARRPRAPGRADRSAAAITRRSSARRSWFRRSIRATIWATSSGASHSSSSAASREQPVRPPALIRGPSTKPKCSALGGRRRRAASASAARPGLPPRAATLSPWVTSARLRPGERHHVAHRAERHQVEPAAQIGLGAGA